MKKKKDSKQYDLEIVENELKEFHVSENMTLLDALIEKDWVPCEKDKNLTKSLRQIVQKEGSSSAMEVLMTTLLKFDMLNLTKQEMASRLGVSIHLVTEGLKQLKKYKRDSVKQIDSYGYFDSLNRVGKHILQQTAQFAESMLEDYNQMKEDPRALFAEAKRLKEEEGWEDTEIKAFMRARQVRPQAITDALRALNEANQSMLKIGKDVGLFDTPLNLEDEKKNVLQRADEVRRQLLDE
jgi:hypothetical protein